MELREVRALLKDLQKRVTRFSSVEQELVEARDGLDQELARQRAIHHFGHRGQAQSDRASLLDLTCESILEIFQVDTAGVWLMDGDGLALETGQQQGLPASDALRAILSEQLASASRHSTSHPGPQRFTEEDPRLAELGLRELMIGVLVDEEHSPIGLAVAGRQRREPELFLPITEAHAPSFATFCEQVSFLLNLRRNHQALEAQMLRLRRSEYRLEMALEGGSLATWSLDPASGRLRIEDRERLGQEGQPLPSPDSLSGWIASMHEEDGPRLRHALEEHLSGKTPRLDLRCRMRLEGAPPSVWRWLHVNGQRLQGAEGKPSETLYGTLRDVTHRVENANRLRELEKVEQESQRLESMVLMAGGVAHDFNNYLTVILANANMALESPRSSEETRKHLQEVENAATHAAKLARHMLTFSGRSQAKFLPFDLRELVTEFGPLLASALPPDTRVQVEMPDHALPVHGNPGQIQQVLLNLVNNASEAMPWAGGTVTIRCGMRECSAEDLSRVHLSFHNAESPLEAGRFVFVEVEDEGEGMSIETQERIFDPFFTTKFTGRGLGLAATLGILRKHGRRALLVPQPHPPGKATAPSSSPTTSLPCSPSAAACWRGWASRCFPRMEGAPRWNCSTAIATASVVR